MRKNPKVLTDRAKYVIKRINERHKSITVAETVTILAKELFLSEDTIWKDYAKQLPVIYEKVS